MLKKVNVIDLFQPELKIAFSNFVGRQIPKEILRSEHPLKEGWEFIVDGQIINLNKKSIYLRSN